MNACSREYGVRMRVPVSVLVLLCLCFCASACVRASVHACMRACVCILDWYIQCTSAAAAPSSLNAWNSTPSASFFAGAGVGVAGLGVAGLGDAGLGDAGLGGLGGLLELCEYVSYLVMPFSRKLV